MVTTNKNPHSDSGHGNFVVVFIVICHSLVFFFASDVSCLSTHYDCQITLLDLFKNPIHLLKIVVVKAFPDHC